MFSSIIVKKTIGSCIRLATVFLCVLLVVGIPSLVIQRMALYRIPFTYMPHLIFYIMPECLQFLLPISLMCGTIATFAKMGADGELLALKASGIQPIRLIWPLLVICFLISFGAWYINDISAICRERGISNVILNGAEKIVYGILKTDGEINTYQLFIKVDSVEDDYLCGVTLHYKSSPTSPPYDAEVQRARIQTDKVKREFIVELKTGYFRSGNLTGQIVNERIPVSISAFLPSDAASNITNAPMGQMIKGFQELNKNIKDVKRRIAGDTAVILLSGEYPMFNSATIKRNRALLEEHTKTFQKAIIEPFRRFTLGFTCFCLVIVAAPMAIINSKMDVIPNVFSCAAPTLIMFAIFFSFGLNFGKQGVIPPWAICFSDLLLILVGLILLRIAAKR